MAYPTTPMLSQEVKMGKIKDLEILAHNMSTADLWEAVFPPEFMDGLDVTWQACADELLERVKKMDTLKEGIDRLLNSLG